MTDPQEDGVDSSAIRRRKLLEKMKVLRASLKYAEEIGKGQLQSEDPLGRNVDLDKTVDIDDSFETVASREIWKAPEPAPPGKSESSAFDTFNQHQRNQSSSPSVNDMESSSAHQQEEEVVLAEARSLSEDLSNIRSWWNKMQVQSDDSSVTDSDEPGTTTHTLPVTKANDNDSACLATRMSLVMPSSCYSSSSLEANSQIEEGEATALQNKVNLLSVCTSRDKGDDDGEVPMGATSRENVTEEKEPDQFDLIAPPSLKEFVKQGSSAREMASSANLNRFQLLKPCASGTKRDASSESALLKDDFLSTNDSESPYLSTHKNANRLAACNPLRGVKSKEFPPMISKEPEMPRETTQSFSKTRSRRKFLRKKIQVLAYCNPLREPTQAKAFENVFENEGDIASTPQMFPGIEEEATSSETATPVKESDNKLSHAMTASTEWTSMDLEAFDSSVEPEKDYSDSLFQGFRDSDFSTFQKSAPRTPPRRKKSFKDSNSKRDFRVFINVTSQDNDGMSAGKSSAPTSPGNTASVSTLDQSVIPSEFMPGNNTASVSLLNQPEIPMEPNGKNPAGVDPPQRTTTTIKPPPNDTSPNFPMEPKLANPGGVDLRQGAKATIKPPPNDSPPNLPMASKATAIKPPPNDSPRPIKPLGTYPAGFDSPKRAVKSPPSASSPNDVAGIDAFFTPFMDFLLGPTDQEDMNDATHPLDDDSSDDASSDEESASDDDSSTDNDSEADSVAVQAKVKKPKSLGGNIGMQETEQVTSSNSSDGHVPPNIHTLKVDRPLSPMGAEEHQFESLPCACGNQEECNGISAGFFMLGDDRAGYIQVPDFRHNAETHFDMETNRLRYALLRPFSTGQEQDELAKSGESLYVANHHFHPNIISSQSKGDQPGILPMYISEQAMVGLELDAVEQNKVINDFGMPTGYYYVVPNYRIEQTKEDLKQAIKQRRSKLEGSKTSLKHSITETTEDGQGWEDRVN